MVHQRKPFGPGHGPDLLRKKSRSTVSWPIFSYNGASWASSAAAPLAAPAWPRANNEAVPSGSVFFQAWIWLACTPNRLDSSATVPSSRTAANATFALNSGPCFFRVLVMSHLRPVGRSQERLSLSCLSSFRGPPQTKATPLRRAAGVPADPGHGEGNRRRRVAGRDGSDVRPAEISDRQTKTDDGYR